MRAEAGFLYALILGALAGLGLTWFAASDRLALGALQIGPWSARPMAYDEDADRYARARLARSGDLPLASGEGIAFVATTDSAGAPLEGRCAYRIAPILPPARWWTLTLYDEGGRLIVNPAGRNGFTSAEILRQSADEATVDISQAVQPGNWLPSAAGPLILTLRLYDSPISTGLGTKDTVSLPAIERVRCS